MDEDRVLRDALEQVQGDVRALRATLAQPEDLSALAPLEQERDGLQAQLSQVLAELAEVEALRDRRTQALADEALALQSARAQQEQLIEALIESLDPKLPEDGLS